MDKDQAKEVRDAELNYEAKHVATKPLTQRDVVPGNLREMRADMEQISEAADKAGRGAG